MYTDQDNQQIQQTLMSSRIIVGVLIVGCWAFGIGAYLYVNIFAQAFDQGDLIVPVIMAIYSFSVAPVAYVMQVNRLKENTTKDIRELCQLYSGRTLIWNAAIEGACFANIVAYIASGLMWSMLIVCGGMLLMMCTFPTETSLQHFIETHRAFE